MNDKLQPEFRFSIMPEWIIYSKLSDKAIRLYAVLARYADNQTHEAFPSRETLADKMGCSPSSVDRAATELVELGAITKKQRHNSSLVYTLRMTRGVVTSDEGGSSPMTRGVVTSDDLTITTELEPVNDIKSAFAQFWDVYPKKDDKRPAQRSFEKALKRATFEVILEGAVRYRDDANRDANYTKNPSTWLNADAWENGPLPVRVAVNESGKPLRPAADLPSARLWVKKMHDLGEHWECRPGEFGCD